LESSITIERLAGTKTTDWNLVKQIGIHRKGNRNTDSPEEDHPLELGKPNVGTRNPSEGIKTQT